MKLNAQKTKLMFIGTFPNNFANKSSPTINGEAAEHVNSIKFLGVTIDNRMDFSIHVSNIISKASERQYLLLKLKGFGVMVGKLKLFYLANVRSLPTYAAPAFYSLLTKQQKNSLELVQSRCTKTILPHIESYTNRLEILGIPKLEEFLESMLCADYFARVSKANHCLNSRLPPKSTNVRILHAVNARKYLVPKSRLQLRESFLLPTTQNFFEQLFITIIWNMSHIFILIFIDVSILLYTAA
jgi:hypothetical protein